MKALKVITGITVGIVSLLGAAGLGGFFTLVGTGGSIYERDPAVALDLWKKAKNDVNNMDKDSDEYGNALVVKVAFDKLFN